MRRHYLIISIICFIIGAYTLTLLSATGTPSTLVVRTDANNYLLVTSATQTNPVTQGVFASRTLRTDSSGSLQVVLTGTVTPTYPMSIPASTCAAPSLGESGATTTGIAFTATPSILNCIAGSAKTTLTSTTWTTTAEVVVNNGSGLSIIQGSIGGNDVMFDTTTTWNSGATTFTGWKLVVTDTASASASKLMELFVGAVSIFAVRKDGVISAVRYDASNSTGGFNYTSTGPAISSTTGYLADLTEVTAPSAGAANTVRIYSQDNGAGKTQVCALFNTGAAQCFATQP